MWVGGIREGILVFLGCVLRGLLQTSQMAPWEVELLRPDGELEVLKLELVDWPPLVDLNFGLWAAASRPRSG